MVNCNNCAYQNFCYGVNKDYCPTYTPAMNTYGDKITNINNNNVTCYNISNSAK